MAEKQLKFNISATDNASATFEKVAEHSTSTTHKIGSAFGQLGSKIGGELGEVLDSVGEGLDKLGEHGESSGKKLMAAGAGLTGLGVALQAMGSKDQASEQQLKAAIDATGGSYEELEPKIKTTISSMENYGHSAADTMGALQTLTTATGSGEKATEAMGVTADLAAAKHESLATAASQVARILGGSGSKTLTQYGIHMATTGDKTKNAEEALNELSGKLSGQAAASADTFSGKLDAIKTKAEDAAAAFGAKFGGAITAAGPVIMGVGAIMESGIIQKSGKAAKGMLGIGAAASQMADDTVAATAIAGAAVEGEEAATVAAGESMSMAVPVVGALGLAVGVLGAAFLSSRQKQEQAKATMESYTAAVKADGGAVGDQSKALVTSKLAADGVYQAYAKYGVSINTVTQAALGNTDAQKKLYTATTDTNNVTGAGGRASAAAGKASLFTTHALGDQYTQVINTANALKNNVSALKVNKTANQDLTPKVTSLKAAIVAQGMSTDATTRKMQQENDAAGLLTAAIDKLHGATMGQEESEISFKNSVANVTSAVKTNGTSLDINKQKGRDNTSAVLDAIQAANSHAEAVAKRTRSVSAGTRALNTDISALRSAAEKAGLNKAAIDKMIHSYAGIKSHIKTTIELEDGAAKAVLADFLQPRFINVTARVNSSGQTVMGRPLKQKATGSEYTTAGATMVGEDGPEIVQMPQGAKVTSNNRMPKGNSGGGDTYVTNYYVAGSIRSDRDFIDLVESTLATRQRRRGKVNIYGG